jgi:hypothetical protein
MSLEAFNESMTMFCLRKTNQDQKGLAIAEIFVILAREGLE